MLARRREDPASLRAPHKSRSNMKRKLLAFSRRYRAVLQKHLQQGPMARVQLARQLGRQAVKLGIETVELARIHKTALKALVPPGGSPAAIHRMIKRAAAFFAEVLTPVGKTPRAAVESPTHSNQRSKTLTQRTVQLTAEHRHLKQGVVRRKTAEVALKKNGKHCAKLLRESHQLQNHLRHLTHQLLSAQEAERTKISHKLQDEVAQTLLGIHVRLLTLKKAARGNLANLRKEITSTQRVVRESVQSIKRFAHELDVQPPA